MDTSSEAPVAPGQCPGGKTPLGGAAPVLCGNNTDSIGCPIGYYCRQGPPDVCCPGQLPAAPSGFFQIYKKINSNHKFINLIDFIPMNRYEFLFKKNNSNRKIFLMKFW